MSNSVLRTQTRERFYNLPAVRRHQQQLQRQQQTFRPSQNEIWRPLNKENRVNSDDSMTEIRMDSDEPTLLSPKVSILSNLDRLMEAVTPFVPAHCFSEAKFRGWETRETDLHSYYCLSDLWEYFSEWSAYGVGVPLTLNGSDSVKQYYVPYLSGIQLYVDPHRPRTSKDSDAGSSDSETDRRVKGGVDGAWSQHNSKSTNRSHISSSSDDVQVDKSAQLLVFEYFEQEQPHHRKPLYDKISSLASQFPGIRMYRSSDLLPASWISVAWYPIYRIPMGQTLQNLDASFLTFHSLSTHSQTGAGKNQLQKPASSSRKVCGVEASTNIPLSVFGLASYKLKGSILTANGAQEWQQASSLLQAADNWLQCLQVHHPDFQFFASHNSQWR
ncbi:uncharacterized protein LOC120143740 isoform X1 [Hibiscus syriacus]|uniref:uncharacterized protein LOC120143740 isoform X1 n=1 Tax=Hibiscus syriacus TaxID=106335 RepID=UPI001920F802|nr:uncharacterized protein LOC120143740 isoform X1 [Hibiscus syriacus]